MKKADAGMSRVGFFTHIVFVYCIWTPKNGSMTSDLP